MKTSCSRNPRGFHWTPGCLDLCARIITTMFPYDPTLLDAVEASPRTITAVLGTMRAMEAVLADGDGLKWFNLLYLQVTQAVEARVSGGGFSDPAWLTELDVQFAGLYFQALHHFLSGRP